MVSAERLDTHVVMILLLLVGGRLMDGRLRWTSGGVG